jgi:Na+-driven multidrug efflux pump
MLAVLAANGALRGLHDTVSTLRVAVAGAAFNAVASVALVYGAGLGIAGSGLATALAQTGMAVALTVRVARSFGPGPGASDAGRPGTAWPGAPRGLSGGMWRPRPRGIARAARAGGPLFARTVFLRVAILATMSAAAGAGEVALAAHQVVMSVMNFAAMAADALEIAGQVLMAEALGRAGPRDRGGVRVVARRLCLAGLIAGLGAGVVVAALAWVFPALFSDVAAVRAAARLPLLMCAAGLPVAGVAFLTDGLLVGAERGGYLAVASAATLAAYLPALAWAAHSGTGPSRLVWVWLAYGVWYMVARVVAGLAGTRWAVVARR